MGVRTGTLATCILNSDVSGTILAPFSLYPYQLARDIGL